MASEMEREGFTHAAADRRRHHLAGPHRGEDRAATTAGRWCTCSTRPARWAWPASLLSDTLRDDFVAGVAEEYDAIRDERAGPAGRRSDRHHPGRGPRATGWRSTGRRRAAPTPSFLGRPDARRLPARRAGRADRLDAVLPDLGAARATIPAILDDPAVGRRPREPLRRRQALLDRIVRGAAARRPGPWSASSPPTRVGDDIELYTDDGPARQPLAPVIHTLRQQMAEAGGPAQPRAGRLRGARATAGVPDYVGRVRGDRRASGSTRWSREFERGHDDYSAILAKALADRLAEAFAERLHERVRREFWGYAPDEALDNDALIHEEYQGIRPAPGLPRLPRPHREADAVRAARCRAQRAGITLTESFAMLPAASVSGYYFWRPEAQYFGVGQDRARPGGGLRPAEGDGPSTRWSAGWRRIWGMSDRPRVRDGPSRC